MNATTQAPSPAPAPGAAVPVDGRSARWAQHREQRRAELLDIARHLIHERGPDVTMEDIAAASGTSKSIVYRYFSDKAQLQQELGRSILTTMHQRLLEELAGLERDGHHPGAEERLHAMIRAYVATAQRSPGVYRFVTRPSAGLHHFLDAVARLVTTFLPDSVPSPHVWAQGAVGFVERSVEAWMTDHDRAAAGADPDPAGDPDAAGTAGTATIASAAPVPSTPPIDADQLVTRIVTWLMKGMHA